jgi:hypothetical protein
MKRPKWKKVQDKKKSIEISAVYNYSNLVLTEDMKNVLSKGLNFCVTPEQINLTELLVDFRKFERSMKWKEHFKDEIEEEEWKTEIFPKEKTNLPPKNSKHLETFLTGIKSELRGTTLNKSTSNIPKSEVEALSTLVKMQKDCEIVIKPCDKGAGILICDYTKYVEACNEHLISVTATGEPYYEKITEKYLTKAKKEIEVTLKKAYETKQITKDEEKSMSTKEKGPGKLYQLFKLHKKHEAPNLPAGRPVISGCNSFTENMSLFVDYHAKHLVPKIPSYLQDTPDLLRKLERWKDVTIPEDVFPVSIDVVGLYTNIPHNEGTETFRNALEKREDKAVTTDLLVEMLSIVLKTNIFEFNEELFLQKIGTAMGTRVAPTYANIFMEKIDTMVQKCGKTENEEHIMFYKRFIDDILIFWKGTEEKFVEFMTKINTLHPTIKFTHEFNSMNKSTTYLDTTIQIKNGKINIDLYRKETDRVQYLLPNSCHPAHICKNVPYSLALRLVRICSDKVTLEKRLVELESMLISRKYNKNIVKNALDKAREINRDEALQKVIKKKNDRVVLAVKYHPKLPSISKIIVKHWITLTRDTEAKDNFPKPPMVAYKQPPNLKNMLCRARLPKEKDKEKTTKRIEPGLKRCFKPCNCCPYVITSNEFFSTHTNEKFKVTGSFNCNTEGVIYLITCTKCNVQYVGQTGRKFADRINEHLYYIRKKKEATGTHFSTDNHTNSDMRVQIVEKVMPNTVNMRLERESMWIHKLATKRPHGLNKSD